MSKYLFSIGLLGLALLAGAAASELEGRDPRGAYPPWPRVAGASLDVLVDGKPLPVIVHRGERYLPIPKVGAEYQVRVRNHTAGRIVALVAVDGLSVINGRPAAEDDTGYLVRPRGQVTIKGWRRNLSTVAAFRFVDGQDSYAGRKGQPSQIGTIRLVAFEEDRRLLITLDERRPGEQGSAARRLSASGSVGTEYGRDLDSPAYHVSFIRSERRHSVTFRYDTVEALYQAGVPVGLPPAVIWPPEFAPPPPR